MFRFRGLTGAAIACIGLCFTTDLLLGQTIKEWSGEVASYNDVDNWDGELPSFFFTEIASISNGGTAFLEEQAGDDPGGLILGRLNVDVGTLEIRDGGSLAVASDDFDIVPGNIVVGQTGQGQLSVLQGGSLTGESLSSGGSVFSTLTLGEVAGGRPASLAISGASNLQRNTTIVGPNVEFSTQSMQLGGGHLLTQVITSATHTPISVADTASLNGTLDVQFEGYVPTIGDTWNVIDAGAISGSFNAVSFDSSLLPPGTGLVFGESAGGDNGVLFQMSVAPRLVLAVDRRTGRTTIENLTLSETIDIDGYLIVAESESLDPSGWDSLADQGLEAWTESNPSALHIGELNLLGSEALSPQASLGLGAIYSFSPTAFGEVEPTLEFSYHLTDGTSVPGTVEFTGLHNNVVLTVDPETGDAAIQNQSPFDIDIDGYLITSETGQLDVDGWSSLGDGGLSGWTESNPSENHIGELNLNGSLPMSGGSSPISLGSITSVNAMKDLRFEVHLTDGETVTGVVEYGSLTSSDPLDCNSDGLVDAGDLNCILSVGGPTQLEQLLDVTGLIAGDLDGDGEVAFADFLQLSQNFGQPVSSYVDGDVDGNGEVSFADFLTLSQNFGRSIEDAKSVPEPNGVWYCFLGTVAFIQICRKKHRC